MSFRMLQVLLVVVGIFGLGTAIHFAMDGIWLGVWIGLLSAVYCFLYAWNVRAIDAGVRSHLE